MDPAKSPLNQSQQNRLNSIMNTPATPSQAAQNQPNQTGQSSPTTESTPSSSTSKPQPSQTPTSQQSQVPTGNPVNPQSLGNTSLPNQTPNGQQNPSPLGSVSSLGQPVTNGAEQPTTYQAPTIGMPTTDLGQTIGTQSTGSDLKPSTNKPIKAKGKFPTTILYVIGGIILLIVYTLIWAVVFDLKLPFGITLPFSL